MATIDTIAGVLESNLDIAPATVTPEATFESLGIDSLDMVELICDLEEACEVDFGEPEGLVTVGDLVAYIESLYAARRVSAELGPRSREVAGPFSLSGSLCLRRKRPVWARAALPEETCLSPVR